MDAAQRRSYLVASLVEGLYSSFYCPGRTVPARWVDSLPLGSDPAMELALGEANTGRGAWEPGWTVERIEEGDAVVATARLRTRVHLAACRGLEGDVSPGAGVSLRLPKELPALSPGFHTVVGDAGADPRSSGGTVRAYWNIGPEGAAALVQALTSLLNAEHVRFRLKVADHRLRFGRCDAAVLYLPADDFRAQRTALRKLASASSTRLRPRVPAFTLVLAPGVGLAEDDAADESFGVRRCELLAEGIVRAYEHGVRGLGPRLEAVATRFDEAGVSIDAPYLEPSLAGRHVL
jgi:hypothetical protein